MTSDQKLPCAICLARKIPGTLGTHGPYSNLCAKCWTECGGDLRWTGECFLDDTPPAPDVRPN
jgi:hypothetical protein